MTKRLLPHLLEGCFTPLLHPHRIHLWTASLEDFTPCISRLSPFLSRDDHERACRVSFERDKQRVLVSRGLVKGLLAGYLKVCPSHIHLGQGVNGKPELALASGRQPLLFNVSHSHDLILFAFSRSLHVGVDVEHVRSMDDADSLAGHFFHPMEVHWFRKVPGELKPAAFFDLWTRKEAYVKATGQGLSCPLDSFCVVGETQGAGRFTIKIDDADGRQGAAGFSVASARGYRAAVVYLR
ncbi:4'-phosphopantetheinyl transferase family protein [Desulfoluna spongiiphila]|uniref:4'-phosphopantetheinyl transferase family protein n=1 Tax=Desulfoluna spongiiphila TaxID=419481 RepID=UPI001869E8A4|nr:4'-phosphopantetheinyl transferase superfamily protein [Desulfoluna spongiiphila]